jgi:hypothetical protein
MTKVLCGSNPMPNYQHTQYGRLHHFLFVVAAILLVGAWLVSGEPAVAWLNVAIAVVLVVAGLMCGSLTVRDEGRWLALRFGPVRVLRKRIPYADITAVEQGRSKLIDGWGIHYVPGRGWTYNLWGFGCVKLVLGRKVIRVGTDDVVGLAEFLQTKTRGAKDEKDSAKPS